MSKTIWRSSWISTTASKPSSRTARWIRAMYSRSPRSSASAAIVTPRHRETTNAPDDGDALT
jgi:hypothetical protein